MYVRDGWAASGSATATVRTPHARAAALRRLAAPCVGWLPTPPARRGVLPPPAREPPGPATPGNVDLAVGFALARWHPQEVDRMCRRHRNANRAMRGGERARCGTSIRLGGRRQEAALRGAPRLQSARIFAPQRHEKMPAWVRPIARTWRSPAAGNGPASGAEQGRTGTALGCVERGGRHRGLTCVRRHRFVHVLYLPVEATKVCG